MTYETLPGGIQRARLGGQSWYGQNGTWVPSVTWITGYIGDKSAIIKAAQKPGSAEEWKRARQIGSKFHNAAETFMLEGETDVPQYWDKGEVDRDATRRIYRCLRALRNFEGRFRPDVLAVEQSFVVPPCDRYPRGFAGTADLVANVWRELIDAEAAINELDKTGLPIEAIQQALAVIDWKTSKAIYDGYRYQIAAYAYALKAEYGLIVRVGTNHRTEKGFNGPGYEAEVVDLPKALRMFDIAYEVWLDSNRDAKGPQGEYDLPRSISKKSKEK